MRQLLLTFCASLSLLSATTLVWSQMPRNVDISNPENVCMFCHSCDRPTAKAPCLIPCQRKVAAATDFAEMHVPDVVIMDRLVDQYVPVVFPHGLHANMEQMGGGCGICHHHNPRDRLAPCEECHPRSPSEATLSQPGLKGAYHRQCLGCHREWSHETKCSVCHARRVPGQVIDATADVTDIIGRLHPQIKTPTKWVYQADAMEEGPVVTFHHAEHIDLFGFRCVDCHKQENCSRCHDQANRKQHIREDVHEDCVRCHDVSDNCAHCHAREERPGFDHGRRTGFVLKPYHRGLACKACHKDGRFEPVPSACVQCHEASWTPTAFDHALAGLVLDDTHRELDCALCHTAGWGQPTTCDGCHDDNRSFPTSLPGTRP